MENINWLKKIFLFKGIDREGLKNIMSLLEQRRYNAGQLIYSENEKGGSLFIIKSGRVRVFRTGKDMRTVELAELKEGDVFGEMSFLDESPHTANISAVDDTELLVLHKAKFEELAESNPKHAYIITKNLLLVIESIIRKMNAEYVSLMEYMYVFGK